MGISWDFMGFSWDFIGGMSPTMCVFVSLQGIQQQGLPHPMGRSYRGYTPSSHAPSITLSTIYTSYLYIIYTYIYITYITYISTIYIYILHNIYIVSHHTNPHFCWCRATLIWKNTRIKYLFCLPCLCLRIGTKGCEGCLHRQRKWRVLPCFPRPPCSVQQIV